MIEMRKVGLIKHLKPIEWRDISSFKNFLKKKFRGNSS